MMRGTTRAKPEFAILSARFPALPKAGEALPGRQKRKSSGDARCGCGIPGIPKFRLEEEVEQRVQAGRRCHRTCWTPVGGDILFVEANIAKGGRHPYVTGQIGDVMQESTRPH